MMVTVIWNIFKKIFGIIFWLLSPLKRLWCRRKRRTSDTILPLSNHYPSVENLSTHYPALNGTSQVQEELSPWDTWEEQKQSERIRSVEEYRQRQQQLLQQQQSQEEVEPDYFQDMTPQLKKQKKVLIRKNDDQINSNSISNKLAVAADVPIMQSSELGSWEDQGNAWEAEEEDDLTWEADNVIKEKRKADRQQRHLYQQRKKQEREQQKHMKTPNQLTAVKLS